MGADEIAARNFASLVRKSASKPSSANQPDLTQPARGSRTSRPRGATVRKSLTFQVSSTEAPALAVAWAIAAS